MEVRPDFRDRVEELCSTIPTSAMHMLLKAVLPKEVIPSMKAPTYVTHDEVDEALAKIGLGKPRTAAEQAEIERSQKRKLPDPPDRVSGSGGIHKAKTRAPKGVVYAILQHDAHRNHNSNTERYWMARAATEGDLSHRSRNIIQKRFDNEGTPSGKGGAVDFAWLMRMGYIELSTKGE